MEHTHVGAVLVFSAYAPLFKCGIQTFLLKHLKECYLIMTLLWT